MVSTKQGVWLSGASGLGSVEYSTCKFAWPPVSDATKYVQELLVARGATNLKVDGKWGPCTESAYVKIFGEPLSAESIQKNLDIVCKTITKTPVTTTCGDGTDNVGFASKLARTQTMSAIPTFNKSLLARFRILPKAVDQPSGGGGGGTSTLAKSTMVAGVPDWALGVGLVAAVAGIAYLIKKR